MMSPELIEEKDFKKSFRGYSEEEVDVFLDEIKEEYEAILKENEALKEKLAMYIDEINKYSSIEDTLKETLITAQSAAEDTTNSANKKAKIIVQEAELQSKQMIDKANNRVIELRNEFDSLVKEFKVFRIKFKSLLQDEILNLDDIFTENKKETESFVEPVPPVMFEATGTMRMAVLEDVQEQEYRNLNAENNMGIITEEDLEEEPTGSPEDIFKIK